MKVLILQTHARNTTGVNGYKTVNSDNNGCNKKLESGLKQDKMIVGDSEEIIVEIKEGGEVLNQEGSVQLIGNEFSTPVRDVKGFKRQDRTASNSLGLRESQGKATREFKTKISMPMWDAKKFEIQGCVSLDCVMRSK